MTKKSQTPQRGPCMTPRTRRAKRATRKNLTGARTAQIERSAPKVKIDFDGIEPTHPVSADAAAKLHRPLRWKSRDSLFLVEGTPVGLPVQRTAIKHRYEIRSYHAEDANRFFRAFRDFRHFR